MQELELRSQLRSQRPPEGGESKVSDEGAWGGQSGNGEDTESDNEKRKPDKKVPQSGIADALTDDVGCLEEPGVGESETLEDMLGKLTLEQVERLEQACLFRRRGIQQQQQQQQQQQEQHCHNDPPAPPSTLCGPEQSWFRESVNVEQTLPGPLKENIGYLLENVLGPKGFEHAAKISWEGWLELQVDLLTITSNPELDDEVCLDQASEIVSEKVYDFLQIAASQVPDIPVVSDRVAIGRYEAMGFRFDVGLVHGQNDCLSDSLLQCLAVAGVLPQRLVKQESVAERKEACRLCRDFLSRHENLRLRPEPRHAFLEEWVHGPHVVRFFLQHFEGQILSWPAEAMVVTHSRFDAEVQDPGVHSPMSRATKLVPTQFAGSCADGGYTVLLNIYCESGPGGQGFHFSPIFSTE